MSQAAFEIEQADAFRPDLATENSQRLRSVLRTIHPINFQAVVHGEITARMTGKEGPAWSFVRYVGKAAADNLCNISNFF